MHGFDSNLKYWLQVLGPSVNELTRKIKGLDFREYAPPLERPRMYFEGVFMFQPVTSKLSFFVSRPLRIGTSYQLKVNNIEDEKLD